MPVLISVQTNVQECIGTWFQKRKISVILNKGLIFFRYGNLKYIPNPATARSAHFFSATVKTILILSFGYVPDYRLLGVLQTYFCVPNIITLSAFRYLLLDEASPI